MLLFFDTETTGVVDFHMPPDHECQPHLVQIAALLTDDDGTERSWFNYVINPGVEIPVAASNVHGITTEIASAVGLDPNAAGGAFYWLAQRADLFVGHNVDFDSMVMQALYPRIGRPKLWSELDGMPSFCTMKTATPICRIPHQNPRHDEDWKWPRLGEAYKHFFGKELAGAHDALVDVRACRDIYFELKKLEAAT